jgi:hypothetical protein
MSPGMYSTSRIWKVLSLPELRLQSKFEHQSFAIQRSNHDSNDGKPDTLKISAISTPPVLLCDQSAFHSIERISYDPHTRFRLEVRVRRANCDARIERFLISPPIAAGPL